MENRMNKKYIQGQNNLFEPNRIKYQFAYQQKLTINLIKINPVICNKQSHSLAIHPMPQHIAHANFLKQFIKFPTSRPPTIATHTQEKITIPRLQSFCQKIHKLKRQHNDIQCITDYDHTLTKFKYQGKRCDSLFGMWAKDLKLPQKFREQLLNNYLFYGPYQTDGTITFPEKYELINQLYYVQTKLFQNHRITIDMAKSTLDVSNLVFRAYTDNLLKVLNQTNIPLYIISGGISDLIYTSIYDMFNGPIFPNISIHSNQLQVYKTHQTHDGHIIVDYKTDNLQNNKPIQIQHLVHKQSLEAKIPSPPTKLQQLYLIKFKPPIIHSYNKFQIMVNYNSKRRNCILMGDLESDIYMARGVNYQTILSIFYAKQGDTDQRAYAEEKFDVIVEGDGSHKILVELIKIIKGSKNVNWKYLQTVHRNLHEYLV